MVTSEELLDFFGKGNLVKLENTAHYPKNMRPEDVEFLAETGLPTAVTGLFTVSFTKVPKAFATVSVSTDEDAGGMGLLCLGAPHPESEFRYALNLKQGFVIVLDTAKMVAEVINESLPNFVEFLYRVEQFTQFKSHVLGDQEMGEQAAGTLRYAVELLTAYVGALDSVALANPESWWRTIFTSGPFSLDLRDVTS